MLTPKRQAFIQHFLTTGNAAEAARVAGYSAKSARQEGARLLSFADVRPPIQAVDGALRT